MKRRLLVALVLTIALPGLAFAVGRPREPRLDPRSVAEVPSYVRRIEPALVGLRVRAREDAPSSARLGARRFATGVLFDARGYAVTVSYALLDAVRIEARTRSGRPWLGLYTLPHQSGVVIDGFASTGPARESGLRRGDRILSVNGVTIASQEEFYEQLWRGRAGDVIRLAVQREAAVHVIPVQSVDRYRLLRIGR